MKFLALLVFIIIQIVFIPFAIIGIIIVTFNQLVISKFLGVSCTAISAIGARWIMDAYGMRKDINTRKLFRTLPNGNAPGLWMLLFPSFIRYKIYPVPAEEGKENISNLAIARTTHMDNIINKTKDTAEQFIIMGAGYDTRCYSDQLNNLKCFELDKANTQKLKMACLKKAGINASSVTFVEVDFTNESWYEKLKASGYDPGKKSIFLMEGVTVYLSEKDVRKVLKEFRENSAPGSILILDIASRRLLSLMRGVKSTNELFTFVLDLSSNPENVIRTFIESEQLKLASYHLIGHKTKPGTYSVVAEIVS